MGTSGTDRAMIASLDSTDQWKKVARAGWVARGLSYSVAGLLTLSLVRGTTATGADADQQGALQAIASRATGPYLLIALAIGLGLFALWQGAQFPQLDGHDLDTWLERGAKVIGVVFYGSLAFTALRLAFGDRDSTQGSRWSVERAISWALESFAGRIATVIAAIAVAAVAARRGARTVTGDLDDDLDFENASPNERRFVELLGRAGEVGRAVSFLIISWFLGVAAWNDDASQAGGLGKSLAQATRTTVGATLTAITGIGFVLFGLYSMFSARHRRLDLDEASGT